jgi:AraC-like DNA-binding protein
MRSQEARSFYETGAERSYQELFPLVRFCNDGRRRAPARGGLTPARYPRSADYINANLDANLSLDALADVYGYSAWHFARLFRQTSGLTPHGYVIEACLAEAKRLVAIHDMTIAEIALRCGMANQSRLSRLLRAHVGVTPARFREIAGGSNVKDQTLSARMSNPPELSDPSFRSSGVHYATSPGPLREP